MSLLWLAACLSAPFPADPTALRPPPAPVPSEALGAAEPAPWRDPWAEPRAALFARERVVDVAIRLSPSAVEALRRAPRTYVHGSVTLDGEHRERVEVRLKGSNSFQDIDAKPSFRVHFDTSDEAGGPFRGLERLVLNNMVSDPAQGREILAWHALADAGLTVPMVTAARVSLNGEALGVYAMIEPLDAAWLARLGGNAPGDVWEANDDADLTPSGLRHFEWGAGVEDTSRLEGLVDALGREGPFLERTAPWLDADALVDYLAWIDLIGSLDGYPYTHDDYFLVADPRRDGRFFVVPWGLDETWDHAWRAQWGLGVLSSGCRADAACREALRARADAGREAFAAMDLPARAEDLFVRTAPWVAEAARSPWSVEEVTLARAALVETLRGWPDAVARGAWDPGPLLAP
ncbi:MAG: hypothetical protein RLZZ299_1542 [Pseudomonadota bacterium]|jgi:hypothetical protein